MIKAALIFAIGCSFVTMVATPRPAAAMSGGSWESLSLSVGSSSLSTISTALTTVTMVAGVMYLWDAAHTRRAYQRASDEARASLSEGNSRPLSTAPAGGVLRQVAKVERRALGANQRIDEVTLARRIIERANQFEILN